jgi:hypothetical protein
MYYLKSYGGHDVLSMSLGSCILAAHRKAQTWGCQHNSLKPSRCWLKAYGGPVGTLQRSQHKKKYLTLQTETGTIFKHMTIIYESPGLQVTFFLGMDGVTPSGSRLHLSP